MKKIMFTKHLEGLDLRGIIESLKSANVDGADLCVRPGYPINPDNIASPLPEAARIFAGEGLSIPLVTAPGDFNQPDIDYAERFYGACSDANVDFVKLGYWHWTPKKPYWEHLDEIRGHLEGFENLSRETGVKTVVHNHSGKSMALNSCAAMNTVLFRPLAERPVVNLRVGGPRCTNQLPGNGVAYRLVTSSGCTSKSFGDNQT